METVKPNVVCAADLSCLPEVRKMIEKVFQVQYIKPESQVLAEALVDADAYYAALQVCITGEMMRNARRLKVITTPSTGMDHIDLKTAEEIGIEVLSLKDDRELLDKITATAELTWALLLACMRKMPSASAAARNGIWGRDMFRGHQIAYKTFGILGCGRLGTIVAEYAKAFKMRVIACDKLSIKLSDVEQVSFDELLEQSDVLSIHIHLTEENTGLIDKHVFEKMKDGSVLINTSRGAIIDEEALLEALQSGKLMAAGLDVIHGEWMEDISKHHLIEYMQEHDNLIITPHVGGVTYESQQMAFEAAAKKLVDYLTKEDINRRAQGL